MLRSSEFEGLEYQNNFFPIDKTAGKEAHVYALWIENQFHLPR